MIKLCFVILILSNLTFSQTDKSNFEFSGIDQFWKIIAKFEKNQEPSNSDWDKLFSTPGYKVLTSGEFTQKFFIDNFRLVFKPSEGTKLNDALDNKRNIHHLTHYIKVRDNKEKIKEQYKRLKINRDYRTALSKTLKYLPQRRVSQYPPVSFVIFESNGRGSSPIVVDLAASMEWDFLSFLSHEYHHWYRNRQLQINLRKVTGEDRDIVDAFSLIEAEGIADMVDKMDWYTKPSSAVSDYARKFLQDVQSTPHIISQIDLTFQQIVKNPNNKRYLGRKILNILPQRGHTTGYFMARQILEHFSKKELTKCVGNPFKFVLLYNDAVKKSGSKYPGFSDDTVEIINDMANKYNLY
jgi:hypothetical protein